MERLQVTAPVRVGRHVLIPVQRTTIVHDLSPTVAVLRARADLHALVVGQEGTWRALGPDGEELPIDTLRDEVPGLEPLMT